MVGALVNGFSQAGTPDNILYYDLPGYGRFGARSKRSTCRSTCTRAIHCRAWTKIYEGHSWMLGPNWAFAAETAVHALRLMGSAAFSMNIRELKISSRAHW